MNKMKYNYVVLGSAADFYRASYADLHNRIDSKYIWKSIDTDSKLLNFLYKLHKSRKLNKFIQMPCQNIWNRLVFKGSFEDDKPICFVLFGSRKKEIDCGLIEYFRKRYPGCRIAFFYQDMVKRSMMPNIDVVKQKADIVLSFDQLDAKNYGVYYYPLVYSRIEIPKNAHIKRSDVYFVGKAKDRLDKIIAAYEVFKNAGLKCDFHIIGVEKENRKYEDEIVYQDQMPYLENLQRIQACKCMLEIMQGGGHGYTLRYCEAIMYDKAIITDNPEVVRAPFYNPSLIQQFVDTTDIETDFVESISDRVDYGFKEKLSPVHLLEFLDERL